MNTYSYQPASSFRLQPYLLFLNNEMSLELSRACDSFLGSTSLLDHHFGIPSITDATIGHNISDETLELEKHYREVFVELLHKLNKLMYLTKVNDLQRAPSENIEQQFFEIYNEALDICTYVHALSDDEKDRLIAIRDFLKTQNDNFKTDTLLSHYFQVCLPILRSVHSLDTGTTTTELGIAQNLKRLYSRHNGSKHNINEILRLQEGTKHEGRILQEVKWITKKLLPDVLKPKLKELGSLQRDCNAKRNSFFTLKGSQVDSIKESTESSIIEKFSVLVEELAYVSVLCDFIMGMVISMPIDWFQDKNLRNVIQVCERFSAKTTRYQLIANLETLLTLNPKDVLMIDFEELGTESYSSDESE